MSPKLDKSHNKCCCGHQLWEHRATQITKDKNPCMACARLVVGEKCQHFTQSYRIIDTDNFGGDYPDEKVVAAGITYKPFADTMAEALCKKYSENGGRRFYLVVEDDYELKPGFEP